MIITPDAGEAIQFIIITKAGWSYLQLGQTKDIMIGVIGLIVLLIKGFRRLPDSMMFMAVACIALDRISKIQLMFSGGNAIF